MSTQQIKCRNCKKMVSKVAKRCPKCGTLLRISPVTNIILISIILFIIAMIIVGFIQS